MVGLVVERLLRAPFPWFGGKALASELVWERLGCDIKNYIEPFFGSGAILLNAPQGSDFVATVNDLDCFVSNFWRSIKHDSIAVAEHANNTVNEADLQARHQYLVDRRDEFTERIKADPMYFDSMIAGWWAWGACCWIGSGWCAPRQRVNVQVPPLGDRGQGVNRQIPHLGNNGKGINRKVDHLGNRVSDRGIFLTEWFERLNQRMLDARVCCGDWKRICSVGSMLRFGVCGVLLDPPYGTTEDVYALDSQSVAIEVQRWCIEHGSNKSLRIALCGHVGQHEVLETIGWTVEIPKKNGGYQGADDRERIWFSPHCLNPNESRFSQPSLFG